MLLVVDFSSSNAEEQAMTPMKYHNGSYRFNLGTKLLVNGEQLEAAAAVVENKPGREHKPG